MMYYFERIVTFRANNRKVAELNEYVAQYYGTLIADRISLDALVEDLRHKVEELNAAYPKTKKLVVYTGEKPIYCRPEKRYSDADAVFVAKVCHVRRIYRFSESAPAEEVKAHNLLTSEPLTLTGSNEPTANLQRTYNDDVNMKGGVQ